MIVEFGAGHHHQPGMVEWEKWTSTDEVPNGIPIVNSILTESIENILFYCVVERGKRESDEPTLKLIPPSCCYAFTVLMLKCLCDAIKMVEKLFE